MTKELSAPPKVIRAVSAMIISLNKMGLPLGPIRLLHDRNTEIPVELIRYDGHDWLVSIFGETRWALRVRKSGSVRLSRGRRSTVLAATEVHGAQSNAVFALVRRKNRMNPVAQKALRADHYHPVFRLE